MDYPEGPFIWVWWDDESPEPLRDGFIVAEHFGFDCGEYAELTDTLAIFPSVDAPERSNPRCRIGTARHRREALRFARAVARRRGLPMRIGDGPDPA